MNLSSKIDKWRLLRAELDLFGNTEPEVELISMTVPGRLLADDDLEFYFGGEGIKYYPEHIEPLIAEAATVSTGIGPKSYRNTIMNLIKLGHDTPFEAIQFNFKLSGISKICGSQLSRHRIGQGHISGSRRYQEQKEEFVYPLLEHVHDRTEAVDAYKAIQAAYWGSIEQHNQLQRHFLSLTKSDRRYIIPAATATNRIWWINGRALRDFFKLRLSPAAESEIKRLAYMTLVIARGVCPTLFWDFEEED